VTGPRTTIRVALNDFRWPLDQALASTRDETTIARALYSTPLRTDASGRVVPGLCSGWTASTDFRTWRFRCRNALQIAAELRRVAGLRASPANWIFSSADRISVPAPGVLLVHLDVPWRRFPYALTTVAAAPRGVPGPFRLVRGTPHRLELTRDGMRLVFRRLSTSGVLRALARGELDEAPVPLGDVGLFRSDPSGLRVRSLLALDAVVFGNDAEPLALRRAYWETANRTDYEALVAENGAPVAYGVATRTAKADPAAYRREVKAIPSLPRTSVRIEVPGDSTLQYGARLLYAQWRELGLGPRLVGPATPADAVFSRVEAVYPQTEALVGALGLPVPFGAVDQRRAFERVDGLVRRSARVVPINWVADARWVSPRLRGWSEDVLGDVDYTTVSPRP
jgi:hypothetical protein